MGVLPGMTPSRHTRDHRRAPADPTDAMDPTDATLKPCQALAWMILILLAYTWAVPFRDIYGLEARIALMAREMMENGLALFPRAMGRPYPDYPPLYFWLEVLFSRLIGHVNTLSVVLPSALSATLLVALTFILGREINRRTGWLAALILATSPDFWQKAGSAAIDMLLALTITAALACLYFRARDNRRQIRSLYSAGVLIFPALAFLTKGPIGIVLPAAAWGAFLLWEKRTGDLFRFALFISVFGAMCVAGEMAVAWETGGMDFVHDVMKMQVLGRVGQKAGKPFYYYLACLPAAAGPWFLWSIPQAGRFFARVFKSPGVATLRASMPSHPVMRLSTTWFLSVLIIFSLAGSKHARYILPLFPALAVILAAGVTRAMGREIPARHRVLEPLLMVIIGGLLVSGVIFTAFFRPYQASPVEIACTVLWLCAVCSGWLAIRNRTAGKFRVVALTALMLATGLSAFDFFARPIVSKRASGRAFVKTSESQVGPDVPVAIFGLGRDRDGVKYALYSHRRGKDIRFISRIENIKELPVPCLLITYEKHLSRIRAVAGLKNLRVLTRGAIRSRKTVSCLIAGQG
ncbi:MAG: hypothetical protein DRH56_08575 [Deltaproteobacteria bacterium]|nr:MAG: hypothetical protein DRH56_08575 [Deltaproteobacteria bacterium]